MRIRVLGSAAAGGFPQWNCNCPNCDGLRKGTINAKARTQSSIAVSGDDTNWALFNASPDILTQFRSFPELQPARAIRDTAVRSVFLMDAQIDHTTGLLMLREGKTPLEIYCTDMAYEDLTTGNPLLKILDHYCGVNWHQIPTNSGNKFSAVGIDHLEFTAVPLSSKAPPYSPHRHDPHEGDNIGMRITDTRSGKKLFYAPGLAEVEPHALVDIALLTVRVQVHLVIEAVGHPAAYLVAIEFPAGHHLLVGMMYVIAGAVGLEATLEFFTAPG